MALEAIEAYNRETPENVIKMPTIDEVKAELKRYDPEMYADEEVLERSAKQLYFIDLRTALINNNIVVYTEKKEPASEPTIDQLAKARFIVGYIYIY